MSRQLEQRREDAQKKRDQKILQAVEYGIVDDVGRAGGVFTGFGLRYGPAECLVTVRATVAGRQQIAFVGAEDLGGCLIKLCRLARQDKLVWRADKYAVEVT